MLWKVQMQSLENALSHAKISSVYTEFYFPILGKVTIFYHV